MQIAKCPTEGAHSWTEAARNDLYAKQYLNMETIMCQSFAKKDLHFLPRQTDFQGIRNNVNS